MTIFCFIRLLPNLKVTHFAEPSMKFPQESGYSSAAKFTTSRINVGLAFDGQIDVIDAAIDAAIDGVGRARHDTPEVKKQASPTLLEKDGTGQRQCIGQEHHGYVKLSSVSGLLPGWRAVSHGVMGYRAELLGISRECEPNSECRLKCPKVTLDVL